MQNYLGKTKPVFILSCRVSADGFNQNFQVFLSLCSVFLLPHLLSRSCSLWSRTSKWTKRQWWSCTQRSCNCLGTRRAWTPVGATRTKALRSDAPSHRSEEAYCTTSKYKRLKSNQYKEEPVLWNGAFELLHYLFPHLYFLARSSQVTARKMDRQMKRKRWRQWRKKKNAGLPETKGRIAFVRKPLNRRHLSSSMERQRKVTGLTDTFVGF